MPSSADLIYSPIHVHTRSARIRLLPNAEILRIDRPRLRNALGLSEVTFDQNGNINGIVAPWNSMWGIWMSHFRGLDPNVGLIAHSSGHVLVTDTIDTAQTIGAAMKLANDTSSGPFVAFSEPRRGISPNVYYLGPCPYWGGSAIALRRTELSRIRRLVSAIKTRGKEQKLRTMLAKFMYAQSREAPSLVSRYFDLSVVLEMLFLPKQTNELAYRFQLRIAKWFEQHTGANVEEVASMAKDIYRRRSHIAHQGSADVTGSNLDTLRNICRDALRAYVLDASTFTDTYLDDLCLGVSSRGK